MQTETQVVQLFSLHVAQTSRNKAGKHTFLYSTIVFCSNLNLKHTLCIDLAKCHILPAVYYILLTILFSLR